MPTERTINAARTHVPLAVMIVAIGITATVIIKGGSLVRAAVEDEYNVRMPLIHVRLDALEQRLAEIKTTQDQIVKDVKVLEIEQARLSGERWGSRRTTAPSR